MGRSPCCEKVGLKKGPWTPEEDQKLLAYIEENGHGSWRALPAKAGLQRCGKSCRLRWTNYLRPDIKRGKFSLQEEQTIIQLHALLGNRWSAIATHLPKRTDNEIKNYWNTHLKKRLAKMGIDPVTHKPKDGTSFGSGDGRSKSIADLSHMAQWESARLEAEARLVRESQLRAPSTSAPAPSSIPLPQQLQQLDHMLRAWQGVWQPKSSGGIRQRSPHIQIDLQSPTSSLSFSESTVQHSMGCLVDPNSTIFMCCGQERDKNDVSLQGDQEVGLKYIGKPIRLILDTKDHPTMGGAPSTAAGGFYPTTVFGTEESWLAESSSIRSGSPRSSGEFGPAAGSLFTDMLLDNSDKQNSSERGGASDSDNAESVSCMEEEEEEEEVEDEVEDNENNDYWNDILHLVNTAPPSNSPPPVF